MFFRNYYSADNKSAASLNAREDSFSVGLFTKFREDGCDTPPAFLIELVEGKLTFGLRVDGEIVTLPVSRVIEVLAFLQTHPLRPLRGLPQLHLEHSPSLGCETPTLPQRMPTEPSTIA